MLEGEGCLSGLLGPSAGGGRLSERSAGSECWRGKVVRAVFLVLAVEEGRSSDLLGPCAGRGRLF